MKPLLFILLILFHTYSIEKDTLTAGLFSIVPYAYKEEGQVVGITTEIIRELSKTSQIPVKTKLLPYKRMLEYLKSGEIDFAIFFLSDYSAAFSDALLPLYSLETIILGNKGTTISHYDDLKGLTIATPRGVNYNAGVTEQRQLHNIFFVQDYKQAILMLELQRIDAVVAPRKILEYQMELEGLTIEEFGTPYSLITNTAWLQFSDKSEKEQYKQKLTIACKQLVDNGTITSIIEKYYYKSPEPQ